MNLVWRHPSGGELWQGGKTDALALIEAFAGAQGPIKKSALVLAAYEVQPPAPPNLAGFRVPLDDCLPASQAAEDAVRRAAGYVASGVARHLRKGRKVLVTCAAGLNRSGLISGLTLRQLGIAGDSAVRKVRRARGPHALSNTAFERLVLE